MTQRYLITQLCDQDPIFTWCQKHRVECYRARITGSQQGWLVEFDQANLEHTQFLLRWSESITSIRGTYYYE